MVVDWLQERVAWQSGITEQAGRKHPSSLCRLYLIMALHHESLPTLHSLGPITSEQSNLCSHEALEGPPDLSHNSLLALGLHSCLTKSDYHLCFDVQIP